MVMDSFVASDEITVTFLFVDEGGAQNSYYGECPGTIRCAVPARGTPIS